MEDNLFQSSSPLQTPLIEQERDYLEAQETNTRPELSFIHDIQHTCSDITRRVNHFQQLILAVRKNQSNSGSGKDTRSGKQKLGGDLAQGLAKKEQGLREVIQSSLRSIEEREEAVFLIESRKGKGSVRTESDLSSEELEQVKVELFQIKQGLLSQQRRVASWKQELPSLVPENTARAQRSSDRTAQGGSSFGSSRQHAPRQRSQVGRELRPATVASAGARMTSQRTFLEDEQKEHLDDLHRSASRLGTLAENINVEIEEQNRLLDDLDTDLDQTMSNMEGALKRMDKLFQTNNRCETCTILILVGIASFLFFLIASTI